MFGSGFDFRRLAWEEIRKQTRGRLLALAGELVDLPFLPAGEGRGEGALAGRRWGPPGIRAQLVALESKRLVNDFVLEGDSRSLHVLNAVSPAFTCCLAFAKIAADRVLVVKRLEFVDRKDRCARMTLSGIIAPVSARSILIFATATAFGMGCSVRSSTPRPLSESEKVIHLAPPVPLVYRTFGDTTRPSILIPDENVSRWPIPPGPKRIVRTGYVANPGDGRLIASLEMPDGHHELLDACQTIGSEEWKSWEFPVRQLDHQADLVIRYRDAKDDAPVVLAQPTISAMNRTAPRVFILFDVDALRKDHLSIYGYRRRTTPNIDGYFGKGGIWENAFSNISWTLPSHTTIFTSTLPYEHGVSERSGQIPDTLPMLAEVLQAAGYRTIAVTNGGYVDPMWGFGRGFDLYRSNTNSILRQVTDLSRTLDDFSGEPTFVFLHTFQVHNYVPSPSGIRQLFSSEADVGPEWRETPYYTINDITRHHGPEELHRWLVNRYDAALATVDQEFGTLMTTIRERGIGSRTAVLLTSDHGERIFDRPSGSDDPFANFGHASPYLYDENLRVPFLLRFPGGPAGVRYANYISLVDVAPTVLGALGTPAPSRFRGRAVWPAPTPIDLRPISSEETRYDALALRLGRYKMIVRTEGALVSPWTDTKFVGLPATECFDTERDPAEAHALPCDSTWSSRFGGLLDQRMASRFAGSVVVRANDSRGDVFIEGREQTGVPKVLSFGLTDDDGTWQTASAARAYLRRRGRPKWVALEPAIPGDPISLEVFSSGLESVQTPAGLLSVKSVLSWRRLIWSQRGSSGGPIQIFTVPAGVRSSSPNSTPTALIGRLRSLGYLNSGDITPGTRSESAAQTNMLNLPGDAVRVEIHSTSPRWTRPAPPEDPIIERVIPDTTTAGTKTRSNSGSWLTIEVVGKNFLPADQVWWDVEWLPTKFVDSSHLEADVIRPGLLSSPTSATISVRNPVLGNRLPARSIFRVISPSAGRSSSGKIPL